MLANDTDVDNTHASLVVSAIRTGTEGGSGTSGTVGAALTGAHGTLTLNADGSYTYVVNNSDAAVQALNTGGTLTDTFTYTVKDPGGLTDTAQLTITINGADDAPVAFNDIGSATEAGGTNNGTPGTNATGNVLANDTDVDNTNASLAVTGIQAVPGVHGTLTLNVNGSYTYVVNNSDPAVQALNTGDTLTDTFTYTVADPGGLSDTAQISITINGNDDAPVLSVAGHCLLLYPEWPTGDVVVGCDGKRRRQPDHAVRDCVDQQRLPHWRRAGVHEHQFDHVRQHRGEL